MAGEAQPQARTNAHLDECDGPAQLRLWCDVADHKAVAAPAEPAISHQRALLRAGGRACAGVIIVGWGAQQCKDDGVQALRGRHGMCGCAARMQPGQPAAAQCSISTTLLVPPSPPHLAQACAHDGAGGCEHLWHAWATLGALVPDTQIVTCVFNGSVSKQQKQQQQQR